MRNINVIAVDYHGTLGKTSAMPCNDPFFVKLCKETFAVSDEKLQTYVTHLEKVLTGHDANDIERFSQIPNNPQFTHVLQTYKTELERRAGEGDILYPDAIAAIDKLHNQGYRIIVQSNSSPYFAEKMLQMGLQGHVDEVVASSLLHLRKPDVNFFRGVANRLDVYESQILGVDNELENIDAMRRAGWKPVFVDRNEGYATNEHHPSVKRIKSLSELPGYLAGNTFRRAS